jgi:hypothetical protein
MIWAVNLAKTFIIREIVRRGMPPAGGTEGYWKNYWNLNFLAAIACWLTRAAKRRGKYGAARRGGAVIVRVKGRG